MRFDSSITVEVYYQPLKEEMKKPFIKHSELMSSRFVIIHDIRQVLLL